MRTCANCGRENPADVDFCACGAYLRWEPTNYQMPAVAPPPQDDAPPPTPPPPATPPRAAAPPPAAAPAEAAPAPATPPTAVPGPPSGGPPVTEPPVRRQPLPPPDQFVSGVRPAVPQPRRTPREPRQPPPAQAGPNNTRRYPAAQPPKKAPPVNPQAPPPSATITLRLPGADAGADAGPIAVAVAPGDRVRVLANVRNQGGIVDNYSLVIHGIPTEWYSVMPETVYLVPLGSRGAYEQELEIHFHPPRDPNAEARRWDLRIGVWSHAAEGEIGSAPMTLGIRPYEDYTVRVRPERATGRRRAKYDVTIVNNANGVAMLAVDAQDNESECQFDFQRDTVELRAGESKVVQMTCKPMRKIWVGRPRERFFEISAASGEAGEKLLQNKAEAKMRVSATKGLKGRLSKIPGVSKPNLGVPQIGIGPGGKLNIQGPRARGPNFRGVNLRPPTGGLSALKMPGHAAAPEVPAAPLLPTQAVYRQKPFVPWWVALILALLLALLILLYMLWPRTVPVPQLVNHQVPYAQNKLDDAHLTLGTPPVTKPNDRKIGVILSQHPKPGTKLKEGEKVNIVVGVGTGTVKVPKVLGMTLPDATAKLVDAQLTKGLVTPLDASQAARVSRTIPAAGKVVGEGKPVEIYLVEPKVKPKPKAESKPEPGKSGPAAPAAGAAAAGGPATPSFPIMLYDNGKEVKRVTGGGGFLPAIAKSDAEEKDPTWAPDRYHVVYTRDGRLVRADTRDLDRDPTKLTSGETKYHDPLFAPTGTDPEAPVPGDPVLVVVRASDSGDGDLCFARVKTPGFKQPRCITNDKISIKAPRWTAHGKQLVMPAAPSDDRETVGIQLYESQKAYSADPSEWKDKGFIKDPAKHFITDLAVSPDGKWLAAAADLHNNRFALYLTDKWKDNIGLTGVVPKKINACKVAWIDNTHVAVVQLGADCKQDTGGIVRIDVNDTKQTVPIVDNGDNPSFRPPLPGG